MAADLMEIQPREIKLTFDLKKKSSCWIQLHNLSDQYVAFKVKATSPKDYSVWPNMSVIEPNATCDFTVTMHRQKVHPHQYVCKLTSGHITSVIEQLLREKEKRKEYSGPLSTKFSKDRSKYIKEKKLRVILVSPSHSPVLLPNNGDSGKDLSCDTLMQRGGSLTGTRNEPPSHTSAEDGLGIENAKDTGDFGVLRNADSRHPDDPDKLTPDDEMTESKLVHVCEELKSKLHAIDSELCQADETIMKLTDERSVVIREKDMLLRELELLRRKNRARRIQVGFPLLFVCMVGLISLIVRYRARP